MASIRVSANGRYFVDEAGEPFFWLGDTQWQLFREVTFADAKAILEQRNAQGFSAIQIMVTGEGEGDRPNLQGHTPWTGNDPTAPNEAYFKNVDAIIDIAGELGLILVLGIYHQRQEAIITMGNAREFARWIAHRYRRAPHIIWTMYPKAEERFVPVCRELAAGIQEGDGGAGHLITVHPDPSPTSSSFIHDEPWLDFNMNQPCVTYELIHPMVIQDYQRTPAKPIVMAEGGYEGVEFGKLQTPLEIRKQAYWSLLAGGHHSYGHQDSWQKPRQWRTWIDSPGAQHLTVYRDVATSCRHWWDLVPDQSIIAEGQGEGMTLNAAARAATGDWVLVYLSSAAAVSVRMDTITAGDDVQAAWIDPTTGERTPIGRFDNKGAQRFSTPAGWQDAVLLLTA